MKYTIAIPTYNNSEILENALISVLNQEISDNMEYNVLVVNNASTDKTMEILEKHTKHPLLKIFNNTETVSLYENHNICLRESNSDYILFCHSDDEFYPDTLKKVDRELSKYHYPTKIVCWGHSFFRDFGSKYQTISSITQLISGSKAQELFQYGGLTPSGTCYSRESFLSSGGFLPIKTNTTPSDMSSMINYSLHGAEFLMCDRLLFKRQFSSTAINLSKDILVNDFADAIESLFNVISQQQADLLIDTAREFNRLSVRYISTLEKHTKKSSLKFKIKYFTKNPRSIFNKIALKWLFNN